MRQIININSNWKFTKDVHSNKWETVTIPHTWNAVDGSAGKEYYKGACGYTRELELNSNLQGKRIYIEFNAVNSIADVYNNEFH